MRKEAILNFEHHQCAAFDLREEVDNLPSLWPEDRRARYLLRSDVQSPLSTDPLVWPSTCLRFSGSDWRGPLTPLWSNLVDLKASAIDAPARGVCVAFTVSRLLPTPKTPAWQAALQEVDPPQPSADWIFLGFDVSDEGFLSSLTNCGYSDPASLDRSRAKWRDYLNDRHLFDDEDKALSFSAEAGQRVLEHAPLFVFGLWKIGNAYAA